MRTQSHSRARSVSESAADLIARTIRDWAVLEGLPPEAPVEAAAQLAAEEFRQGAGVLDSCAAARRLLRSWTNHPSSQRYLADVHEVPCGPLPRIGAA
jgi:hypothetical protein